MKIGFYQLGGAIEEQAPDAPPQEQGGGAPLGGQDPMMVLMQLAQEAVQGNSCEKALEACQILVQLTQQAAGAQAPPQEGGGQPVFRRGGKLVGFTR